jgi:hypothetical protein
MEMTSQNNVDERVREMAADLLIAMWEGGLLRQKIYSEIYQALFSFVYDNEGSVNSSANHTIGSRVFTPPSSPTRLAGAYSPCLVYKKRFSVFHCSGIRMT